jgi:hypothetical protein
VAGAVDYSEHRARSGNLIFIRLLGVFLQYFGAPFVVPRRQCCVRSGEVSDLLTKSLSSIADTGFDFDMKAARSHQALRAASSARYPDFVSRYR